ncbi:MAG: hypothetical protein GXP63_02260, partial [DPANN group archaeon]|nr:hypothetical protein [DPANN group archaeon]
LQYDFYQTGATHVLGKGNLSDNDVWNCTVTPYDGYENGTSLSDKVTVTTGCVISTVVVLDANLDCSGNMLNITSSGNLTAGSYTILADTAYIDGNLTDRHGEHLCVRRTDGAGVRCCGYGHRK